MRCPHPHGRGRKERTTARVGVHGSGLRGYPEPEPADERFRRGAEGDEMARSTGRDASTAELTFVGTATTVIRLGSFTVLTDPNFLHRGQRAYLGKGLWSRRLTEPAIDVGELPPLHAVVLSHLHGDHFDRVARRGLPRDVPLLTTPQAARRLDRYGFATD